MRKIDLDAMVNADAGDLGLPPLELCRRALEAWSQSQTGK